jgi:hypothetical protein
MFYDLIFHPSGLELKHRELSGKDGGFKEKKITSAEFVHKFGYDSVEKGEYYEYFKKTVKEALEPYRIEFNSLNIVVAAPFFQFKELTLGLSNTEPELYINWEICQLATDVPEHYVYGYFHDQKRDVILTALTRKTVDDYFKNLIGDLYGNEVKHKLCSYYADSDIIVTLDKQLKETFEMKGSQINSATVSSTAVFESAPKKSGSGKFVFLIILIAIATASYFLIPQKVSDKDSGAVAKNTASQDIPVEQTEPENIEAKVTPKQITEKLPETPVEKTAEPEKTVKVVEPVAADDPVEKEPEPVPVVPAEKPMEKPSYPEFWAFVNSLVELGSDSIVFTQGTIRLFTSQTEIGEKVKALDESGSFTVKENEKSISVAHSSFILKNYKSSANYDNFIDIKNDHSLFSSTNTYPLGSVSDLRSFLSDLGKKKVRVGKFSVTTKDSITFSVSFD